jgi:hypothetical protein
MTGGRTFLFCHTVRNRLGARYDLAASLRQSNAGSFGDAPNLSGASPYRAVSPVRPFAEAPSRPTSLSTFDQFVQKIEL